MKTFKQFRESLPEIPQLKPIKTQINKPKFSIADDDDEPSETKIKPVSGGETSKKPSHPWPVKKSKDWSMF